MYPGYISSIPTAKQPVRQLHGLNNVGIKAGQHENVKFELRHRDISYWDVKAQKCAVAPGTYTVHIGTSSSDLRPHGTFTVQTKG
jgi:beta-glucosidase